MFSFGINRYILGNKYVPVDDFLIWNCKREAVQIPNTTLGLISAGPPTSKVPGLWIFYFTVIKGNICKHF